MKERIENIEKRLDRVERMIEKIIALPQLTNLAGKDIALQLQRTNLSIDSLRAELRHSTNPDITKILQENLARCESLVSPALPLEPRDDERSIKGEANITQNDLKSKQENKSVRINLLFRPNTKKNIEKLALVNQTSINDFINTVLDEYIAAHADEIAKYDSFFSEG